MSKIWKVIVLIFLIVLIGIVMEYTGGYINLVKNIKKEFEGAIIDKFSTRDLPPTHYRVRTNTGEILEISPYEIDMSITSKGDSIIKKKYSKYYFIYNDEKERRYLYVKILPKHYNSIFFPDYLKDSMNVRNE